MKDTVKRRDGLNAYFSEETELKDINSFQKQSGSNPRRQVLDEPAIYEFKVAAHVSDQCATWFDGLEIARDNQGNTLLLGTIIDQAALHGVLKKVRDLGLPLVSVNPVVPDTRKSGER